ncbi:MAG: alpha/beta fold hydrolase [Flavobacteriaceae bacterium]|nr:alpha/beta fold hydrolase [Flavobacteriaceae bacterium]
MILHSQIIGTGTPLLILHGFLGMGDNWKTLGNRFATHDLEVHLIDQRNHGRSFHHSEFSYEAMAEDLLRYLDHYKIEKCYLLGHSMGGKTAMQFAIEHPQRVEKLIVADIAPKSYPQHHQDILKSLGSLDFEKISSRSEADRVLANYIPDLGTRQFLLKNLYWVSKGKLGLRVNLEVVTDQIAEVGKALPASTRYEGPVLFLRGERSGYIEDIDLLSIKRHFPQAVLKTVSSAGHWLHAENPDEFYRYVMNFL